MNERTYKKLFFRINFTDWLTDEEIAQFDQSLKALPNVADVQYWDGRGGMLFVGEDSRTVLMMTIFVINSVTGEDAEQFRQSLKPFSKVKWVGIHLPDPEQPVEPLNYVDITSPARART
jgi:hypothetical protein